MAKRRGNGEGSVYRRGDGRIVGEYVDANGNRRYVSGKTKAEVGRKLRGLLADRDEGIAYDSENLTVGAYLARWLLAAKGTVRQRTWERHEQVVRLHLRPSLGATRLDRLTALQVQSLYGRKLEEELSPRTVEIVHATLHKALKQAMRWSLIPCNAAEGATPPRPVGREIRPLSQEQARALLDAARGEALEAFWVLAVTTGMRNGELLALQWRDVDPEARTLRVRRSVFNGVVSPPKTAAGNRTVRLVYHVPGEATRGGNVAVRVVMVLAVFLVLCGCDRVGPAPEEQAKHEGAGRSEPAPGLSTQPSPDPAPAPVAESVPAPAPVVPVESPPEPALEPALEPAPAPAPAPAPEPDPGRCLLKPPYSSDCGEN